ncbi:DUF4148 domain-containing protein [Noviherbaspirillum sp.]|uniref:DUF4148 domain-containing protein n=1 Tax=Noviherbaspirillum sp. TaxID=1926288 RepID=UPI002B4A031E|nr:DUF4148 domain-containing protein [Noviherbaspirillum sp.]HJV79418.1 DUF4148 domain-containing protein [Noviherbaspirillum sp.]
MNAKNLIAAVAVLTAAGSALADQTYPYVDFSNHASTKTRAEVIAEMQAATPAELQAKNTEYVEFKTAAVPGKTRAEVRAELEQAYASGQVATGNNEYVEFTHVASTRSREEVRNEAMQAARNAQGNHSGS